jgi:hypothetical protein
MHYFRCGAVLTAACALQGCSTRDCCYCETYVSPVRCFVATCSYENFTFWCSISKRKRCDVVAVEWFRSAATCWLNGRYQVEPFLYSVAACVWVRLTVRNSCLRTRIRACKVQNRWICIAPALQLDPVVMVTCAKALCTVTLRTLHCCVQTEPWRPNHRGSGSEMCQSLSEMPHMESNIVIYGPNLIKKGRNQIEQFKVALAVGVWRQTGHAHLSSSRD